MRKGEIKREEILNYIKDFIDKNGYPPSYREIAKGVNIKSTNSIKKYLDSLEKDNLLTRSESKNRSIDITDKDARLKQNVIKIPLVGKVAAGIPILAVENLEEEFIISKSLFGTNEELFMLKISGDSMVDIGIDDGDYVVVKKQNYAGNGEIVVAYLDGYSTVKTYYNDGKKIRLQPQNPLYSPIYTTECEIIGKVVGSVKRFT